MGPGRASTLGVLSDLTPEYSGCTLSAVGTRPHDHPRRTRRNPMGSPDQAYAHLAEEARDAAANPSWPLTPREYVVWDEANPSPNEL